MNYGYATDDDLLGTLEKDKEERYPLQMYRRLLSSLPIALEGRRLCTGCIAVLHRALSCRAVRTRGNEQLHPGQPAA